MRRVAMLKPVALAAALALTALPAAAEDHLPSINWSFDGIFGTFDKASAQRGFSVYQQICAGCHAMKQMYYRNLAGIGLNEAQIKAVAAADTVPGSLNDKGEPTTRPGTPADHFKAPFPNDIAARAAMGGALPPDQSVLELAREGEANYVYGILTGYADAPAGVKVQDGLYYNKIFPGHQIAMPPPLADGAATYTDGTKPTLDQEARDVTTFLAYAANPELDQRHRMGVKICLFLIFMTGITYVAKRRIWAGVH